MAMLIRPYAPADYAAVTALWDATGITAPYNDFKTEIPRMHASPNCQLYLGCVEDRVMASILVGHEGYRGWIYKVAVMSEFRGKGYGRDLVKLAERWLVARGIPKCLMLIRNTNLKVRDFYMRLGYQETEFLAMERWLKPAEIDMAPAELDVVTTYLEMTERPTRPTVPLPAGKHSVLRLERPSAQFYRYLYALVGESWMWSDRRKISDRELEAEINAEGIEIYVLYAGGEPAGYVELDRRPKPDIRIAYFGLGVSFIGRGLGRYLLNWAVDQAWSYGPQRLLVATWSFDHSRAFANYQKAGFKPYQQTRGRLLDPRIEGTIPVSVQPRVAPAPAAHP